MLKKFIKLWLPVLIWAIFVFYLSSLPNLSSGLNKTWDTILRKIAHMAEYAILFMLLTRAWQKPWKYSLIISICYALSDEFHQSFVPGRVMGLADICFDTAGVFIGQLLYPILVDNLKKNDKINVS